MTPGAAPQTDHTIAARRDRRRTVAAFAALAFAFVFIMQALGWAQTSYYALTKALQDGTPQIDRYHWETRDKSYTDGHFFSVKAPGLSMLVLPLADGLDAVGGRGLSKDAAIRARKSGDSRWAYKGLLVHAYGGSPTRAKRVRDTIEHEAPFIWALGLLGTVIPSLLLLVAVRWCSNQVEPGTGTTVAILLGAGTLIFTFATELFGHALAAALSFGAFALLWRERRGPPGRLPGWSLLAIAGLLSGLAVTTEYPLAIAGAILGVYALGRSPRVLLGRGAELASERVALLRRGLTYSAGVAAGVAPLIAYNLWAFGSATHLSYADAVDEQGTTGHATLGLNGDGLFGITIPKPWVALELLITSRGLLILSPALAIAVWGVWRMRRDGRFRAEANVILAIAIAYLVYDSGYWLPFGGGTPGPRFLVPLIPFVAVGLAVALRRVPAIVLVLAGPSFAMIVIATCTYPLIGSDDTGEWMRRALDGTFTNTLASVLGAGTGWLTFLPIVAAVGGALALALKTLGPIRITRTERATALKALAIWAVTASTVPLAFGYDALLGGNWAEGGLIATGAVCGLLALGLGARVIDGEPGRRPWSRRGRVARPALHVEDHQAPVQLPA